MRLQVFAILDKAVAAFNTPLFFRSRMEAIRSFEDAVRQEGSQFALHSEHYSLMFLGEFDDQSGQFTALAAGPELAIGAHELLPVDEFSSKPGGKAGKLRM